MSRPAVLGGPAAFPGGLPLVRPLLSDVPAVARRLEAVLCSGQLTNGRVAAELEQTVARQKAYVEVGHDRPLPVTDHVAERVLSPPLWSQTEQSGVRRVAGTVAMIQRYAATVRESTRTNGVEMSAEPIAPRDVGVTFRPQRRDDVADIVLDGEAVLCDEASGALHHLDRIATIVWQCLDGGASIEELAAEFADGFGAAHDIVCNDVLTLVRELGAQGLLVGVIADESEPCA